MPSTLNVRAGRLVLRHLFLAPPTKRGPASSLSVHELSSEFCEREGCESDWPCRKHSQAVLLAMSKMVAAGDLHAEMSKSGRVFVRLAPQAVLGVVGRERPPLWVSQRPDLVEWAGRYG